MKKRIITSLMLSTTLLSSGLAITLQEQTGVLSNLLETKVHADQTHEVNIPDENLKAAINQELGQSENSEITKDKLSTLTTLDVDNRNIKSLEGLQYCVNLTKLKIGTQNILTTGDESNTITDLSPLKNLSHLKYLLAGELNITDFSPVKNLPLDYGKVLPKSNLGNQTKLISAKVNEDGSLTFKNPCVNIDGTPMSPQLDSLHGGTYNPVTNEIRWTDVSQSFSKDFMLSSPLKTVYTQLIEFGILTAYRPTVFLTLEATKDTQLGLAYKETSALFYKDNLDYFSHLNPSVTQEKLDRAKAAVDSLPEEATLPLQSGKTITKTMFQNYVGLASAYFNAQKDTDNLFEGSNPETNHLAAGVTRQKIDDCKKTADQLTEGYTKTEMETKISKAYSLLQTESTLQTINLGGMGCGSEIKSGTPRVIMHIQNNEVSLIKNSNYQFHFSGWTTTPYASIKISDPSGNILYNQSWKGNQKVAGAYGEFAKYKLSEGSIIEVYHAEGPWHRFSTDDNANLKTKFGSPGYTYTYKLEGNKLVLKDVNHKANK
ncbi:toxin Cry1Ac domain D-VI-related protein [Lactococcus garvieae]|uniref:Toxin Cry1Ac domain D-VI-related protein n=1 Tax=Lactococcus garvieae TaxID=1363 RepID=A0AA46TXG4_9LACT|nr:toxin Cry1Ac domain D-VI-related protein [Lactococcus garvieae]UYT10283.1 toxin Cry1Ac domain D-VI-related protein [Lactococcus garvieae]UYT12313.1 toxin Cry1Ac domain D-VI-related protein [Lactococcus garvieae]